MYENRIAHLEEAHRLLDEQIVKLETSGNFSDEHLQTLKKKKLLLKDEIAKMKKKQWEEEHERVNFDEE
jgi:hypothetical protein